MASVSLKVQVRQCLESASGGTKQRAHENARNARVETQYPPLALALPKLATTVLPYFSLKSLTAPQIVSESTTAPPPLSMRRTTAPIVSSSPASFKPRTTEAVPKLCAEREGLKASESPQQDQGPK